MKTLKIMLTIALFSLVSCEKEELLPQYEKLYGKWFIYEKRGARVIPLEGYAVHFIERNKVKYYENNEYYSCGRFDITKQNDSILHLQFSIRKHDIFTDFEYSVTFFGLDTMSFYPFNVKDGAAINMRRAN